MIRPARPDEDEMLTALALRSKAHWGYDQAFMDACVEELTLTPAWIEKAVVLVEEYQGEIIGMVCLDRDDDQFELCHMFVDPPAIGSGAGGRLFRAIVAEARRLNATSIRIDADPNAEGFYAHQGAQVIGRAPSGSIPGRTLPQMLLRL